jgi:PAS domain S-box-containing protein
MRWFRNMPIRWKLMLAMMLTSVFTLLLLGPGLFLTGYLHLRNLATQETAALAEIVGGDCAHRMADGNVAGVEKELGDLEARKSIEDAFFYDNAGRLVAQFTQHGLTPRPPPPVREPGESFDGDHLELYRRVQHNGVPMGTICLHSSTQIVWVRLQNYAGVGTMVMGISMLVALIFARRLERIISEPILELVRIARGVTEFRDFSMRAPKLSNDEIGALTEAFNQMLVIIQEQDSGSRVSQSRLEKRVNERTVELRKTSEALRDSEERLRVVFEEAMDGFAVADEETKQLQLFNPRLCRMLGYTAGEMAQLTVADIHPPKDLPRILETFAKHSTREVPLALDVPVQRKDGSVFYVDIAASPLTMNGRRCVLGIFRDTTERKQAREALQRRLEEEQFVASVSSRLANITPAEMDAAVREILGDLGRFTRTDRCYLFRVSEDLAVADNTHEWCVPGVRSQIAELHNVPTASFPWYLERLRGGNPLLLRSRADLPAEAVAERRLAESGNTVSSALVPIRHASKLIGFIGCETTQTERDWGHDDPRLLRTIGELIINTMERLRAEQALRESQERLRLVLDNSRDVIYRLNLQTGQYDFFSQAVADLTGYSAEELFAKGLKGVLNEVHPDDLASVRKVLEEARTSGTMNGRLEYRFKHKHGEYRWLSDRFTIVPDAKADLLFWVGVSRDVTERKLGERQMLHLASFPQFNPGPVLEADLAGNLTYCNPATTEALQQTGVENARAFLPRDWTDIVKVLKREPSKPVEREIHLGARVFEERICFVPDGKNIRIYSRDITQRQQAENALKALNESLEQRVAERTASLRQSEERYRVLIETTNTGFVVLDTAGRILEANAEYVRLTGYDRLEDILGRKVVEWTAPHDRERNVAEVKKCAEKGFIRNLEVDYVNRQGQITPIEINATVVGRGENMRILSLCRDITERKRAEAALLQSEEKFRRIAAHIQDVLYSVDIEKREFRYLSPAFEKMLGYTEADIRDMGGRVAFLNRIIQQMAVNSQEQARRLERLRSEPKDGMTFRDEEWWRCKDGSLKCIEDRWIPVFESGRLVSTEGLLSDITVRKHAEDALRQSEKQFRAVFETAAIGMGQTDPQTGQFLRVNQKLCEITGYSEEELLARRVADITHPDDRERDRELFQNVVQGATPEYHLEKRYVCKGGTTAWVNVNMTVIRDAAGQPMRTLAAIEDITERKRAEAALAESAAQYRSLVDNLNIGVYRNTPDGGGRFLQANPALARMHGYDSVAEFVKLRTVDLYENPADREAFIAALMKTGAVTNHEVRLTNKNGNAIFCAITAKAHYSADGKMDWVDGIVEDITERKRLERQLIEVSEREQHRIGQDLHDGLCQHLAGVGYMSKALARKLDVANRAEAEDARTLADLIRQAIADARATASGLYPVKMETDGIVAALQTLAANVESLFHIQCVFHCDPPVLLADNKVAIHLYRIAQEAVNNALHHGKARRIEITLAEAGRRVTLTVRDDGLGLPDPLPARRGIGLDIMHHRARMIRGTLDIRRAPESGTLLTCSFPLADAA